MSHRVTPQARGCLKAQESSGCIPSQGPARPVCLGHGWEGAGARAGRAAAFPGVPEQPDAMQTLISPLQRNSMHPSVTFFALNQVGEGAKVHVANVGMHSAGT